MDQPPRRVGKRLIGRFLFLRIMLGTTILILCTLGSVFWVRNHGYDVYEARSQALNVLNFCAISITMSARFSRKSAFHPRTFRGNLIAGWSYAIMIVLQVFITYTPGLNKTIFWQTGMDGIQWLLVVISTVVVFIVMEGEKSVRNYLTYLKYDTNDEEYDFFDTVPEPDTTPLPKEVRRFGQNELHK
jgi:magnesium-transporting ATPase (P-type)